MNKDSERPQGSERSRPPRAEDEGNVDHEDIRDEEAVDDGTVSRKESARPAAPPARGTPPPRHPKSIPLEPASRSRATERRTPAEVPPADEHPPEVKPTARLNVAPSGSRGTVPGPGKVEKDLYLPSPARPTSRTPTPPPAAPGPERMAAPTVPAPPSAGRGRAPASPPPGRGPEHMQAPVASAPPTPPAPPPVARPTDHPMERPTERPPSSPSRQAPEAPRATPLETPAEHRPPSPSREEPFRAGPPARSAGGSEARRALLQTREAGHEIVMNEDRLVPGDLKLVIEQGLSINKEFLVSDPEMLMGRRDPDQDFIPDIDLFDQETATNRYISRRQARLFFKDGCLWVEDLDSSNGTAVNNRLIPPHEPRPVKPGDKILLGQSVMVRVRRMTT